MILITSSVLSPAYGALLQTFDDPTPTGGLLAGDNFGTSVSIDGNLVLVGAPNDDTNGLRVGQAHLYDSTTSALLQTFDDPTITAQDGFGISVSISGNNVLVGAHLDDTNGQNVGQAHLFDATTGLLLRTFDDPTPTPDATNGGDQFGQSVSIDGNLVLVGAPFDDTKGILIGQAHLFDATTGLLLHTFDDPTPGLSDRFGLSVSISGNLVLVGDFFDNTLGGGVGQAHLFDATTGLLLRTFNDPTPTPGPMGGDAFGQSVSIDGNLVLVGAPEDDTNGFDVGQAHLFDATTGLLLQTFDDPTPLASGNFGSIFGVAVAISGNNVLVGVPRDNTNGRDVGQAHLFDATTGLLLETLDDPTPTPKITGLSDNFGASVAMFGNCALVGAPGDDTAPTVDVGQAHLFGEISNCGGAPPIIAIGGNIVPLDTTMVLVAGTQTTAAWMIPVIVSVIGFAIVIARKF